MCVYKRGEAYFKWVPFKVTYGEGEITPSGIEGRPPASHAMGPLFKIQIPKFPPSQILN